MRLTIFIIVFITFLLVNSVYAEEKLVAQPKTIEEAYPNLASGVLTYAKAGTLTEGVLLKADNIEMRIEDVNKFIVAQPEQFREELKKNAFFVLEQVATDKLLLQLAKKAIKDPNLNDDKELIKQYIDRLTEKTTVSEEDIQKFYKENEAAFCGTPLEKVKGQIGPYVLQEKKQRIITEHIRTIGPKMDITVSQPWVTQQMVLAKDNPLDKIRGNDKPTLAVFSAASCCGPDKMLPVLESIKSQYAGNVNIMYLEAKKEQILAARYNVYSIPSQIFFDKTGKEIFRHTGFFAKDDIVKKFTEMGVK